MVSSGIVSPGQFPLVGGGSTLSVAVIGPDEARREIVARALEESDARTCLLMEQFSAYPFKLPDLPRMLEQRFDVVFIDLDSNTEYALELVEALTLSNATTVMVYSEQADRNLVIRCMRAGAREFLNLPLAPGDMAGALARLAVHDPAMRRARGLDNTRGLDSSRSLGKRLCVFLGAKGGCGVTTVATSFALALAQESGQSTLLIDLGLPLGDAAIQLGMACHYSTANALEDWHRLDGSFLNSLLAEHPSGLRILAAPSEFPYSHPSPEAYGKLLFVARQCFQYVVVDIGTRMDLKESALFDESSWLYLVIQAGISELRNANRFITQSFLHEGQKLQVVLNRYAPHTLCFDASDLAKALTHPVDWTVPDDKGLGRDASLAAARFADENAPIPQAARQMARAACGASASGGEKKRAFGLFR